MRDDILIAAASDSVAHFAYDGDGDSARAFEPETNRTDKDDASPQHRQQPATGQSFLLNNHHTETEQSFTLNKSSRGDGRKLPF